MLFTAQHDAVIRYIDGVTSTLGEETTTHLIARIDEVITLIKDIDPLLQYNKETLEEDQP